METLSPTFGRFAVVPLVRIHPSPDLLRDEIDQDALEQLADSMSTEGLHQAIGVRGPLDGDQWEIIWGHRRYLAAGMLGWQDIKAMLYPADFDPLLAAVHENLMRADLSPLEEAKVCARLRDRGYSLNSIARLLRRSQAWVTTRVHLLAAPPDVQEAVHHKKIPIGVATALTAIDDPGYRGDLLAEAERTGCTVSQANIWIAEYAKDRVRLLQNRETVTDLIRRAQESANFTDCQGCTRRVPWAEIYSLRLCGTCAREIDSLLTPAADSPPPPPPPEPAPLEPTGQGAHALRRVAT